MAATAPAIQAILTAYEIKFPVKATRIQALRAEYLRLFESKKGDLGKALTSFSADGQTANWAVNLSTEEVLSAYASALRRLDGTAASTVRLFAAD